MASATQSRVIFGLLQELHDRLSHCREGAVADYIPELAKADPHDFGIVVAMADGRIYAVGDTEKPFTIQSISKPFAYGLALQALSVEHMQRKVGVEPSGEAFNAISLDPETGRPRNPMINAGAIATSAQLQQLAGAGAETLLLNFFSQLAGRELTIDREVYASERDTGHRNRAISHLLRNVSVIEGDVEPGLDLYFRQCAISVTCRDLGVMAATLACQGRNPITGERPLEPSTTVQMLSLMGTCGMYDAAGQWLHDVGMPAKSGVAGGVLAVVPGQFGIAVYSPPLDSYGNSVRGVAACKELSERLNLHLYDQNPLGRSAIRRSYTGNHIQSRRWRTNNELVHLRDRGQSLRILHAQGVLDFSGTEQLLANLEGMAPSARVIVLDMHHVQELLPHSLEMLIQTLGELDRQGIRVVISRAQGLIESPRWLALMEQTGIELVDELDIALELGETLVLQEREEPVDRPTPELPSLLLQLDPPQRRELEGLLRPRTVEAGERVIRRGDDGDSLFLIVSGHFTTAISVQIGSGDWRHSRLATFTTGMCFGEISFLSGKPRSADVIANEPGHLLVLGRDDFEHLRERSPETAIQLLLALSSELGGRLGRTSYQLSVMDHL